MTERPPPAEALPSAAKLARLREALEVELRPYLHEMLTLEARDTVLAAALTKIAEMLK